MPFLNLSIEELLSQVLKFALFVAKYLVGVLLSKLFALTFEPVTGSLKHSELWNVSDLALVLEIVHSQSIEIIFQRMSNADLSMQYFLKLQSFLNILTYNWTNLGERWCIFQVKRFDSSDPLSIVEDLTCGPDQSIENHITVVVNNWNSG